MVETGYVYDAGLLYFDKDGKLDFDQDFCFDLDESQRYFYL